VITYLDPPYKVTTSMLWWQKQGLQQTATGYGGKLTSPYMLETPDGRKRRVYAMCYSNAASHYVLIKGQTIFLRDGELETARDTGEVRP
jgi:hypothetical protein